LIFILKIKGTNKRIINNDKNIPAGNPIKNKRIPEKMLAIKNI